MMTDDEKYEYWLEAAEYDLGTADTLYVGGRWLYVVFMCQQAIEKLVKALYILYVDDEIPRIHNITKLVKYFEGKLPVGIPHDRYDLFDRLSTFYLNNWYPDAISKIGAQVTESVAGAVLTETKGAFAWLLTLKP
ncbi:MAG: HEPN domain-containing protein [Chitinispirillia bacterium]|nr:HEPN domain-containing protein [Chitinispirillia bacterium]